VEDAWRLGGFGRWEKLDSEMGGLPVHCCRDFGSSNRLQKYRMTCIQVLKIGETMDSAYPRLLQKYASK